MSKSSRAFITSQMHLAYSAITHISSDDELSSSLQLQGFSSTMIDQGETAYEAATLAVSSEIIVEEQLEETVKISDDLQKKIREVYVLFTDTASKCFGKDALEMLGLRTGKPRSSRAYCESLKSSVNKLISYPELSKRMQAKGFDSTQIQHAAELTTAYENTVDQLIRLEKNLENAAKKRNTAMFTLRNWLSSFAEAVIMASESKPYLIKQLGMDKKELYTLAHVDIRRGIKAEKVH